MSSRCCCGIFSVTTGAQILTAMMIWGSLISFMSVIVPTTTHTTGSRVYTGISSVFQITAASLVFIAIQRKQSILMAPILVVTGISMISIGLFNIVCIYGIFDQHSVVPDWIRLILNGSNTNSALAYQIDVEQYVFPVTIVVNFFVSLFLLFSLWSFTVYSNCFRHLKQIESSRYSIH
ncbi:hypothetical protein PFISCL1PPCAC_14735 [Pristionchus fissidentatus]|uniref:G protein-coupled receptor n=1 Tax=Pristionchus fissidentatus TaxID=1538716 RepID=A0AAV5VYJ1_9BILA|nr:hypothetical protein PFISCL1PPCAC_14735 [Pristionchus fissidentatus]